MRVLPSSVGPTGPLKPGVFVLFLLAAANATACGGQSARTTAGAEPETECARTEPEPLARPVSVVLRNERVEPVYVLSEECSTFFRVRSLDPSVEGEFPQPHRVLGTWATLGGCWSRDGGCGVGRGAGCNHVDAQFFPYVLGLAPNEEVVLEWRAALYPIVSILPGCVEDSECQTEGAECIAERAAPTGRYRLEARALLSLSNCTPYETCPCTRFSDGLCRHQVAQYPDSVDLVAEVELDVPGDDSAVLAFR